MSALSTAQAGVVRELSGDCAQEGFFGAWWWRHEGEIVAVGLVRMGVGQALSNVWPLVDLVRGGFVGSDPWHPLHVELEPEEVDALLGPFVRCTIAGADAELERLAPVVRGRTHRWTTRAAARWAAGTAQRAPGRSLVDRRGRPTGLGWLVRKASGWAEERRSAGTPTTWRDVGARFSLTPQIAQEVARAIGLETL